MAVKRIEDSPAEAAARAKFEQLASDPSYKFARSRKGNYVNGAIARDWKWFSLGIIHAQAQAPVDPKQHPFGAVYKRMTQQ